jgi:hypothetical protein
MLKSQGQNRSIGLQCTNYYWVHLTPRIWFTGLGLVLLSKDLLFQELMSTHLMVGDSKVSGDIPWPWWVILILTEAVMNWKCSLFLAVLGFELGASLLLGRHCTTWATSPALFCVGYFRDGVLGTISLGWLQIVIFLIFASRVARFTSMSHWH